MTHQQSRIEQYEAFLSKKVKRLKDAGFEIHDADINPALFDFQRHIVKTALKKGRYAIFADCGLGKTLMQLEWARHVSEYTGKPALILCPLAVAGQTVQEGTKFGIQAKRYDCQSSTGVYVLNYDQLDKINPADFAGVVLDESSILKNFEGKTRTAIIDAFADTPYKLACTATPSPNDPMELGNHSEFLNVMSRNEMLAMYFIHDGGNTSKWRLKGHAEQTFWDWVSTWAVMLGKPSDIGFSATGYDLPPLHLIEKQIKTKKRDNGKLFNDVHVSATDFNRELKLTKVGRLSEVCEIVNGSDEQFLIWIRQDEEGDYLRECIPGAIEVRGSHSPESKEENLLAFARGEYRVLITKTKIAQFGLNFQNCHNQVFASLDFSFEGLYQAIRRSYRFGQKHPVDIYMVTTDTMQNVIAAIEQKQAQFENMQRAMKAAVNKNINSKSNKKMTRQNEVYETDRCKVWLGDCVKLIRNVISESIGFSIFSPPFAELYTYSNELEDMGNSKDYAEFLTAFKFLVDELFRVMIPGRNVAVHCMDLPIQKGKEGYIGVRDFSNMIREAFEDVGFIYHSRITIWKDPVTEMQRTKALGLLHKQVKKDATMSRAGMPDYLLVFRHPDQGANPVTHQDSDPAKPNYLPVSLWQKYASPVWMDINQSNTLNKQEARDEKDEKHICPLQLDVIERAIHLWTNEGDTVLSPFAGIGSELYQALKMNRKAIGFELKKSYFDVAVKNCEAAQAESLQAVLQLY